MAKKAKKAKKAKTAKKAKKAKKATGGAAKRGGAKRSSAKRERLKSKSATFYAKRTGGGQFKEMDEVGRSQKADRRTKAKTKARPGYGDQGDQ